MAPNILAAESLSLQPAGDLPGVQSSATPPGSLPLATLAWTAADSQQTPCIPAHAVVANLCQANVSEEA